MTIAIVPQVVEGPIVAFGGTPQEIYEINILETNKITISFSNVVYRNNSTLQYKILPTIDNSLYNEIEGHQNYSWGVYIIVKDDIGNALLSETLTDARLSNPFQVENGKKYTVLVDLTLPDDIKEGNYTVRFVAVSSQFNSLNQTIQYIEGNFGGAVPNDSIATKQIIWVKRTPISERKANDDLVFIIVIMLLLATLFVIIVIKRYREKEKRVE